MADTLKPGDVVKLKSGGPPMTITHVFPEGAALAWFEGNNLHTRTYQDGVIALDALERK